MLESAKEGFKPAAFEFRTFITPQRFTDSKLMQSTLLSEL